MEAYKIGGLGNNDEDAKKIKEAERDVSLQINRDKKSQLERGRKSPTAAPVLPQRAHGVPQLP